MHLVHTAGLSQAQATPKPSSLPTWSEWPTPWKRSAWSSDPAGQASSSPARRVTTRPNGGRWIELAPGDDNAIVTLEPAAADVTRGAIGIRFTTDDAEAAHAASSPPAWTPTRSCAGPAYPPCSPTATPDGNAFFATEIS